VKDNFTALMNPDNVLIYEGLSSTWTSYNFHMITSQERHCIPQW